MIVTPCSLGFGNRQGTAGVVTLGFCTGVFHRGGDDRIDDDYDERKAKRLARIRHEEETILKAVVTMVTRGFM